jgi:MFS family permease
MVKFALLSAEMGWSPVPVKVRNIVQSLSTQLSKAVPSEHRLNFRHFYFDIGWFGVLASSSVAFAAIYAARLGASGFQLGLLNALPSLTALIFALPAGWWSKNKQISRVAFWSAVAHRLPYLFWVLLPFLFTADEQVNALLWLTFLMSIPGTLLAISFNGLFATAVPAAWRNHVVGRRNALYAFMSVVTSALCGWLLHHFLFPGGYQFVFMIGFIGAVVSTWHLWYIRPTAETASMPPLTKPTRDWAQPGLMRLWHGSRRSMGWRFLMENISVARLKEAVWQNGRFRNILLLNFLFHIGLYLPTPLFPIYLVQKINIPDLWYSMGNGLFFMSLFLGSTQLSRLTDKWGNHKTLAIGAMLTCFYPFMISQTTAVSHLLYASIVGGLAWSIAGGVLGNYILDLMPESNQPVHLAWYNLSIHGAILIGSLSAPFIMGWIGLVEAMVLAAACRLMAGLLIWKFG